MTANRAVDPWQKQRLTLYGIRLSSAIAEQLLETDLQVGSTRKMIVHLRFNDLVLDTGSR